MDATIERLIDEKAVLQRYKDDFETLCKDYGAETIDAKVRDIRDIENAEKRQRRLLRRSHEAEARRYVWKFSAL